MPSGSSVRRLGRLVALCALMAACGPRRGPVVVPTVAAADPVITASVTALEAGDPVAIDGETIVSTVVLPDFYRRRGLTLAWTDDGAIDAMVRAVRDSAADGLEPSDYHLAAIEALRAAPSTPERRARRDLLLTDAAVVLGYHLRFGKAGPVHVDGAWTQDTAPDVDLPAILQRALDDGGVYDAFEGVKPRHPSYTRLKAALAEYRRIAASGGWPDVPPGKRLALGATDARVPLLRRRLGLTGDLPADVAADPSARYDAAVADGVKSFQERHGLPQDGAVGEATWRALDVPVGVRIDQIRAALDRSRWVMQDLPERFILVDVARYGLAVVDREVPIWETRVVVGDRFTQTPSFRADMKTIVLNPSWTIPPGMMRNEIGPAMQREPGYLERKGYRVVNGQVMQPPGPRNALGRIKLLMPNRHHIYLHDTPSKSGFTRTTRTFSHGCVRVEKPFDLAALALDDPKWTSEALLAAAGNGKTRTIALQRPLPVLILYRTATADAGGRVRFLADVYGRDPEVVAALAKPVTPRPRAQATDVSSRDGKLDGERRPRRRRAVDADAPSVRASH